MPSGKGKAAAEGRDVLTKSKPDKLHRKNKPNSTIHFFSSQQNYPVVLKKAANKLPHQHVRQKSSYEDNKTASLTLSITTEELLLLSASESSLLHLSKKNIIEHATMRIDLFFYTLCAYYQKNLHPIIGHTYLQHGRGRSSSDGQLLSAACHNSMLPALIDETILDNNSQGAQACILSGTYFIDSLNSTTELPPFINALDDKLEALCREKSLSILSSVSSGKINPIEGLSLFLQLMKTAFEKLKLYAIVEKDCFTEQVIKLFLDHTLKPYFDEEQESVTPEYIFLLLQLTPKEKTLCFNGKQKTKIYMEKWCAIQEQILSHKEDKVAISP